MTAIERTAYPGFSRAPQLKELFNLYTPKTGRCGLCGNNCPWPKSEIRPDDPVEGFPKARLFSGSREDPWQHYQPHPRRDGTSR